MAQKVLIARDEIVTRDNLPRPNCNSDGKANNKRQAFINTDTRHFKIQMGVMGPPPRWQGLVYYRVIRNFVCKISTFNVLFFP